LRNEVLLFLGALLLLAAGLLWRKIASRSRRQREALRQAVERLGTGDFQPVESYRFPRELGPLARALADTSARLGEEFTRLSSERDFSAAVLAGMTEGVAVVDAAERILFCNQAFAEAVGGTVATATGRPLLEVARHSALIEAAHTALAGHEPMHVEVEFGTVRPRTFALTAAPVVPHGGAVLVLHDVTEIRRLERVRRDFVANVSHELRTPLTTIQGFAETLLGGAMNDRQATLKFLEIIRAHAARLGRLTDDLLKLSAIEGGSMTFRMEPVSVPRLVDHCIEAVSLKARACKLEVSRNVPEDLPAVRGDSLRLEEVLKNLLENAIQYTPSPGTICVRAAQEGGNVVLCVEDTGIGIPSTEQQRIFERFYRVDAARSRELGGTGLGLSIAKHIVEAHQGRLWVESELGRGSRFFVSLAVFQPEAEPEKPETSAQPSGAPQSPAANGG
jgi:two-component system phosphate regulon sensor histidine kinase PhoR